MRIWWPLALWFASTPVAADPATSPITDRNYAIDLYDGVALGNSSTIGMGGASAANAIGSSGTLVNPSAPAVRPTTDTDTWSWDYHLDYFNSQLSSDYTNSGLTSATTGGASAITGGLALRVHDWAGAITISTVTSPIAGATIPVGGINYDAEALTLRGKAAVAAMVPQIDMAFGAALQLAQFVVEASDDQNGGGRCQAGGDCRLFAIQGAGLEAGTTWIPAQQSFRLGGEVQTPIAGGQVVNSQCTDLSSCDGFTLPESVVSGWRVVAGGAYRWAETNWNHLVGGNFRDEKSVTAVTDVVITGPAKDAFGLDAFGQHLLERSGRHTSISLRGGVEYEWVPGRFRIRGGSYWEPGRFEGVSGRLHVTFGLEVRVFEFYLWGRRRGRITLTGDSAPHYQNLGLSIGFWH